MADPRAAVFLMAALVQGRLQLDYIQMGLLQSVGHQSAVDRAARSCQVSTYVGSPALCGTAEQGMEQQGAGYMRSFSCLFELGQLAR